MTVCFYPRTEITPPSLLVLLLVSVYVSLSKNSFLRAAEVVSSLADAKVRLFRETPNFLQDYFYKTKKNMFEIDKNQLAIFLTPFIIYARDTLLYCLWLLSIMFTGAKYHTYEV